MIYVLETDEPLLCLKSEKGTIGASDSFDKLESKLASLKGRRFYGLYKEEGSQEHYYACVGMEEFDDPIKMGLQRITLSKGKYDRELLRDWQKNIRGIPLLFNALVKRNEGSVDDSRFRVEYYRSQKELYAMLPTK